MCIRLVSSFIALLLLLLAVVLSNFIVRTMIAVYIVITIIDITINIYRHINEKILFERFNNTSSIIVISFDVHFIGFLQLLL